MSAIELADPARRQARTEAGTPSPGPLAAGARLQEFEITAVIGQGGFGIVYLARDLSLQRRVAIKEYMPAHLAGRNPDGAVRPLTKGQAEVFELGRRSFINEARMLARFKHPGLVEVLRFWEQNGTAYMAMPYYDGATLTQYLKRHPKVATEAWLKKTLKPLVDALGHMHDEDCFHRDVAPDNILILKDGSAVLLDLGAARRVIANDAQAMTVMLKPGYAPIEQYSDDPRFRQGPWTDIYAMAAVFFFAITGKPPPASASRVMRDSVSPLASVQPTGYSEGFLRAIDQGLSLQPEDRPRSIADFRALLYATPPAQPPQQPRALKLPADPAEARAAAVDDPFAPPAASRTPFAAAVAAGVFALVAASLWYGMQPQDEAEGARAAASAGAAAGTRPTVTAPESTPATATATVPMVQPAATPAAAEGTAVPGDAPSAQAEAAAGGSSAPAASTTKARAAPPGTAAAATAAATAATAAAAPAKAAAPANAPAKAAAAAGTEARPAEPAARPAATATGTVVLAVKPWADVRVNGVSRGHSPPMKQLTLPAGRHTIELHNPASAPVRQQIEVRANQQIVVSQQF